MAEDGRKEPLGKGAAALFFGFPRGRDKKRGFQSILEHFGEKQSFSAYKSKKFGFFRADCVRFRLFVIFCEKTIAI